MQNRVIDSLNIILKNELTAINQYFLHARILENQGFEKLGQKEKEESIDEMNHADDLIKRILFLGGLPNLQDLGKLFIGENAKEMLECDLRIEKSAIKDLKDAIDVAEEERDTGTVILLEDILKSEEEHLDWLTRQLNIIDKIGLEKYLQSQI